MALSILWRYGFAIVLVGAAFGLCSLLRYVTHYRILIPFFAAVIAAGWCGGRGPAWAAVALSLLAVDYFFGTPLHSWQVSASDEAFFIPFAVALVIAGWCGSLRKRSENWAAQAGGSSPAN